MPGFAEHDRSHERPSNGVDAAGMESRMDEIRLKQILGGALTDQELMCLQIEQNGFGCRSCSSETGGPGAL